jgi:hypothetical protein
LKRYRQALAKEGVQPERVTDHGNAWAFYFRDPESNPVEMYCDTPSHTPQPRGEPLDLDQSNDEIARRTEAMCRNRPRFMSREAGHPGQARRADRADLASFLQVKEEALRFPAVPC